MATILDELVTVVRLDPTGFSEGQRRVISEADRLRDALRTAGRQINLDTNTSVRGFLGAIHQELQGVNLQLVNLGATSRRQGETVRSGGQNAAVGMRNLAEAGLAAYAAVKLVHETIQQVGSVAGQAFQTERAAAFSGISVQNMQRIQAANFAVGGIPIAETQSALSGFEAKRAQYRVFGQYPEEFIKLAQGLHMAPVDLANISLDQLLDLIAIQVRKEPQSIPDLRARLTAAGFGSLTTLLTSGDYQGALSDAGRFALSDQEVQSLTHLAQAAREAELAWSKLVGSVVASHPEWTKAIEHLVDLETWLANNKEAAHALGTAFELIFGGVMIKALQKFAAFLVGAEGAAIIGFLGKLGLLGAALQAVGLWTGSPIPHQEGEEDKKLEGASQPSSYRRPQGWEWLNPFNWAHGVVTGYKQPQSSTGTAEVPANVSGLNLTSDDTEIMMRESQGRARVGWSGLPGSADYSPGGTDLSQYPLDATGFPDWPGKMGPRGNSTAAGLFMITKSNWHRIAPQLGIHDFSPKSQLRVRRELQREAVAAGQPANQAWAASGAVLPVRTTNGVPPAVQVATTAPAPAAPQTAAAQPSGYDPMKDPQAQGFWAYNRAHPAAMVNWNQYLAMLKNSDGVTHHTVSNDNSVDNNVHANVTVNGAGNPYLVGGAVVDAIRKRMVVNSADNGLM